MKPGELLAILLRDLDMTQKELAARMGRPAPAINEIINGKKLITPKTALELERVLRVPAIAWLTFQAATDLSGLANSPSR